MKIIFAVITALSFFGLITYNLRTSEARTKPAEIDKPSESMPLTTAKEKLPVLVELFTSEGCSSCPPADRNLIYLKEKQPNPDAELVTLSMHVDYWNRLGWTDPFSSAKYSQRQEFYSNTFKLDGVYTPQMVVDGTSQFVGGNIAEAQKAVSEAVRSAKGNVELAIISGNKLQVKISSLPEHSFSNVFVAIAEDNLSTSVRDGENSGRTLNHTSVVRKLETIGTISAENNNFETETSFQVQPSWKKQNLKLVVFAQVEQGSRVIGVGQIRLVPSQ